MSATPPRHRPAVPLPTTPCTRVVPLSDGTEALVVLERFYWEMLDDIASREATTTADLVRETDRRRALLPQAMVLEPALRLLCVSYYLQAADLSGKPAEETLEQLMDKAIRFQR